MAGLLTLALRRNRARARYGLWLVASLKFLVPFAALVAIGSRFGWDNLAAALHMLVQALFWFHPLVWWLGSRLVDERERACDEEVIRLGSEPQAYAERILRISERWSSRRWCAWPV